MRTKQAQKKKPISRLKIADQKMTGAEPDSDLVIEDSSDSRYSQALSWYNYYFDAEDAKKWLIEYMISNHYDKMLVKAVQSAPKGYPSPTAGFISRLLMRNWTLPEHSIEFMNIRIEECKKYLKTESSKKPTATVDRGFQKTMDIYGKIDDAIDEFSSDNSYQFSLYSLLSSETLSPYTKEYLRKKITSLYEEVKNKMEGFEHLKGVKQKAWVNFYKSMLDDLDRLESNKKIVRAARKPRKVKQKPAIKLVEKMKYLEKSDEMKVVSINPADIIKAQSLWVFNVKTRQLSVYWASTEEGLSVKGTTITNFNEETSMQKRLRKPEEQLKSVLSTSKLQLKKLMATIKTVDTKPSGRINADTILLRVVK